MVAPGESSCSVPSLALTRNGATGSPDAEVDETQRTCSRYRVLMLRVKAGAYSVEAANPRHEHEWKIWKEAKLPDGKILIPGVVSHASNVVEHPELVADRIVLYASLVGRENVIAGTDCGMGMRVHPQIAWAKLKALGEGAALASKELWGTA